MTFWSITQTRSEALVEVQLYVRFHICLLLWQLFLQRLRQSGQCVNTSPNHPSDFYVCVHVCSCANAQMFVACRDCSYSSPGCASNDKMASASTQGVNQQEKQHSVASIGKPSRLVTMTGKMDEREGMTRSQRSQDDLAARYEPLLA